MKQIDFENQRSLTVYPGRYARVDNMKLVKRLYTTCLMHSPITISFIFHLKIKEAYLCNYTEVHINNKDIHKNMHQYIRQKVRNVVYSIKQFSKTNKFV